MNLLTPDFGLTFWMLISFGVVVFVLVKFGFPIILNSVEERKNYIDESLLIAKQAREELESVKADSQAIIDKAHNEQAQILSEATALRTKIINEAKEMAMGEANKIITDARSQILLEKEDALRQIRQEVAMLSVDIAEKVLRNKLDNSQSQMDMIDRLLDEVNIPKS